MKKTSMQGNGIIPTDIAYLTKHGILPEALIEASVLAERWQVPATDAVIAMGLITKDALYRALAAELEVPFLPASARASGAAIYKEVQSSGILPLADNEQGLNKAIAPDGYAIKNLLQNRNKLHGTGTAITSPCRFAALVRHHFSHEIATEASYTLIQRLPQFSFLGGVTRAQRIVFLLSVILTLAGLLLMPLLMLEITMLFLALAFLVMALQRSYFALVKPEWSARSALPPPLNDAELPVYTVIVPLYSETRVIPQLIHALTSLDYPTAKLDIKLVLEEDDLRTRKAIEACAPPEHIRIQIAPDGHPRTKPRALNVALAQARGEFAVVYDAEDIPDPQQLRQAAAIFKLSPDTACLQAHLVIDNASDGFLSCMFAIEYAALFDAVNPGLTAAGMPLLLGGTSNHLRLDILRKIGGWDAWNVTEDADLGIRLARLGYQVRQLPSITREEAPIGVRAWLGQRGRWMKGWMQVCITHSRHPIRAWRELGATGFITTASLTFGTIVGALGMPLYLLLSIRMIALAYSTAPGIISIGIISFSLIVWIVGILGLIVPILVGLKRRRRLKMLWALPLLPLYMPMLTIAAWRGLFDLIAAPCHWHKTGHGLSRRRTAIPFKDIS